MAPPGDTRVGSPGGQQGQMLVSVIVLLTLMFFIGTAMALAVSSSLHAIAQSSTADAASYSAESAVAQGFARRAAPVNTAPEVSYPDPDGSDPLPQVTSVGCNGETGNSAPGNGGTGTASWSYAYEVIVDGSLVGRSAVGSGLGRNSLDATHYMTITIPRYTAPQGASVTFELYRTSAGGDPSTLGCISVASQQSGTTVITDPGPVSPAPPMCTSDSASQPFSLVNGFGPGGMGALTAMTCRVPTASGAGAVQMWSAAGGPIANGACLQQGLTPSFSPGAVPATLWGVAGWQATSGTPALEAVSTAGCGAPSNCSTRAVAAGVVYYWCLVTPGTQVGSLGLTFGGGTATLKPLVVSAAPSGTDCLATSVGQAGIVVDEAAQTMPGCNWPGGTQALWNRVMP